MRRKSSLLTAFAFLLLLCMGMGALGSTWAKTSAGERFVSPSGDDSNPGTEARPWRTIQKAAGTLVAGQIVYIKNGEYHERVSPVNSGSPGNWIVYAAYPGHSPVIDGSGVPGGYHGLFEVGRRSYIEVRGLTVWDSEAAAIYVSDSSNIVVRDNRTEDSASSGIGVWRSSQIVVTGNVVVNAVNAGWEECITIADVTGFEVSYNEVARSNGTGIDVKEASSHGRVFGNVVHDLSNAIYVDAWDAYSHHHEVFGNYVYDTSIGIILASERGGTVQFVDIYNNLVVHVAYAGIIFADHGWDGPCRDVTVFNNTIVESFAHGGAGILVRTYNAWDIVLKNNVFAFGPDTCVGQIKAYVPERITSVANLVWGPKCQTQDPNLVEVTKGTIEADPRFVGGGGWDFHLRADSPAIDTGVPVGLTFDFDGAPRPVGSGYDIGAFERQSGAILYPRVWLPLIQR